VARRKPVRTATCPQCGEGFPAARLACPHCGSDAQTGWRSSENVDYEAADVPDAFDDEDYEDVVDSLPGAPPAVRGSKWTRRRRVMVVAGIVLVAAFIANHFVAYLLR
jgi:hypothetical protein